MIVKENASLKPFNTFQVEAFAKYLVEIEEPSDITEYSKTFSNKKLSTYILGGGSNILFTKDFEGVLLHSTIKEIKPIRETNDYVIVKCGSGVNWDDFVEYCVARNWGGIENLSDIPGNVGAAPVQNIGAYGVEAKETVLLVEGVDYLTGKIFQLRSEDCQFSYRNSVFKSLSNKFISYVYFKLQKAPTLVTHYGKVEEELGKFEERNIRTVRQVIINIRRSKLPSVKSLGSAGSFFKNPVVENELADKLSRIYPEMPCYVHNENMKKLSAAWFIDNAGLKGFVKGNVGTYNKQPLVIANLNNASGKEIADFSVLIQNKVFEKYGIKLVPEVIFI